MKLQSHVIVYKQFYRCEDMKHFKKVCNLEAFLEQKPATNIITLRD